MRSVVVRLENDFFGGWRLLVILKRLVIVFAFLGCLLALAVYASAQNGQSCINKVSD
jgi:hypothetical protein